MVVVLRDIHRNIFPPIKGFIETSFIDWRGVISAVIFLPGCNLACPFCHNYTLASNPNTYLTLKLDMVLTRLANFTDWIDGVVISGGEPTLQPGLDELLAQIKAMGFLTKLDTNGLQPKILKNLCSRGLVDMIAMDIKAPLESFAYTRATGKVVNLSALVESITFLIDNKITHEFRSTIWPTWHSERELLKMSEVLKGAQAWTLQALNPQTAWQPSALGTGQPYSKEEIFQLQIKIADLICNK